MDTPVAELQNIVNQALISASHALTQGAFNNNTLGMRTTLIVIVATSILYFVTHCGDGACCVRRNNGVVENFVEPQRMPGARSNVLAASLGPIIHGAPRSVSFPVLPGDLLLAGTDGIFDLVDENFPPDILAGIKLFHGDLQRVAETAVCNLDPFCSDNMTLALALRADPAGGDQ